MFINKQFSTDYIIDWEGHQWIEETSSIILKETFKSNF